MAESPRIPATFTSRCGLCDQPIEEGDEIEMVDGEWCHGECVDEDS